MIDCRRKHPENTKSLCNSVSLFLPGISRLCVYLCFRLDLFRDLFANVHLYISLKSIMHPEFLLLALVFLISVVHGVVQPRPHVRATPSGFKKRFQTLQSKLSLAGQDLRTNVPLYIKRTPSAVVGGIQGGASSFLSSLAVLLPIAIVLSIKPSYPRWKTIFANGLNTGVQWAGISGLFMVRLISE